MYICNLILYLTYTKINLFLQIIKIRFLFCKPTLAEVYEFIFPNYRFAFGELAKNGSVSGCKQTVNFALRQNSYICKKNDMEGTRLQKVGRLLQKELSEIFQREGAARFPNKMLTITQVRVSPDLSVAKVYLSIFPSNDAEKTLEHIRDNSKFLRGELGKRVRHQVRVIPELTFFIDDSLDYIDKIDQLLKE